MAWDKAVTKRVKETEGREGEGEKMRGIRGKEYRSEGDAEQKMVREKRLKGKSKVRQAGRQ